MFPDEMERLLQEYANLVHQYRQDFPSALQAASPHRVPRIRQKGDEIRRQMLQLIKAVETAATELDVEFVCELPIGKRATAGKPINLLRAAYEVYQEGRPFEVDTRRVEDVLMECIGAAQLRRKGIRRVRQGDGIFIGHGRSLEWLALKTMLEKQGLRVIEYNQVPTAGKSRKERLLEMLDACRFAFLVMTAEDEHNDDDKLHARENVTHEAGLFQGRLGFERAIVLQDEDCQLFSNLDGLDVIRFETGKIVKVFNGVIALLKDRNILRPDSK